MRNFLKLKLIIPLVTAVLLVSVVAISLASSGGFSYAQGTTPIASLPCFPNTSSSFTYDVFPVPNGDKEKTTTSGDVVSTTGKLVLRFTNETTQKTIVKNVSGPTTVTTSPDGKSVTFQGTGNNWLGFGPHGQANTGEPGLVFTSGLVTVTFASGTAQTFSLNGHQDNGCALLS